MSFAIGGAAVASLQRPAITVSAPSYRRQPAAAHTRRPTGAAPRRRAAGRAAGSPAGGGAGPVDAAWEELRRHHAGKWHGEWSELGAGGEAAPAWLALTSVRFEEDSGACVISRQNFAADGAKPMGEPRGGTLACGQPLSNHMLGPMYQGAVAAGPRVVFEAGMSHKADTRVRVAVEYLRGDGNQQDGRDSAAAALNKVTVIREQLAGFPTGKEAALFGRLDEGGCNSGPRRFVGQQYAASGIGGTCVAAVEDTELYVDGDLLSAWGYDASAEAGWIAAGADGRCLGRGHAAHPSTTSPSLLDTAQQQVVCLPGRLAVSVPRRLDPHEEHRIQLRWFPAEDRLYASECCFRGPEEGATSVQLDVHFQDLRAQ